MKQASMIRVIGTEQEIAEIKQLIAERNASKKGDGSAIVVRDWTPLDSEREVRALIREFDSRLPEHK
jgi:hypothetical protein